MSKRFYLKSFFAVWVLVFCQACAVKSGSQIDKGAAVEKSLASVPGMMAGSEDRTNTLEAKATPYVILVSIDGFRYDYPEKKSATTLLEMTKQGVRAESLIPVFPSSTFPNHYSIVTGLYADQHGIVSNRFLDPKINREFSYKDPTASESIWWRGEPLWVTAKKKWGDQCLFFLGGWRS